jgi:hypothetical protein
MFVQRIAREPSEFVLVISNHFQTKNKKLFILDAEVGNVGMATIIRIWNGFTPRIKFGVVAGGIGLSSGLAYQSWNTPKASPLSYGPLPLLASVPVAKNAKQLTVQLSPALMQCVNSTLVPYYFNIKNDDLVVARSYTPVHLNASSQTMDFLVKRYPVGETSKWMHNRIPLDSKRGSIEMCGPLVEWTLPPPMEPVESSTLGMVYQ